MRAHGVKVTVKQCSAINKRKISLAIANQYVQETYSRLDS